MIRIPEKVSQPLCFLNASTSSFSPYLQQDMIHEIFFKCLSKGDIACINSLCLVNVHHYIFLMHLIDTVNLKVHGPWDLSFLDAETLGIDIEDEPQITNRTLLKSYQKLVRGVEDGAGVTRLTMYKGLKLNYLLDRAEEAGIDVGVYDDIIDVLGDICVEHTYVILISNNILKGSRGKATKVQLLLLKLLQCDKPEVPELVALLVFTYIIFNKCLYGDNHLYPYVKTYSHTSTHIEGLFPLIAGGCFPTSLTICEDALVEENDLGTGGKIELKED